MDYTKAIELDEDNPVLWYWRGLLYYDYLYNNDKALKDFEKALLGFATSEYSEFMEGIEKSGDYNDDIGATLKELLDKFVTTQTW